MEWNSELYRENHAFVFNHGASVLELLSPAEGEDILDVGCGTGELTQAIAEHGARVVGIDHSPQMIAAARARFPTVDFRVADAAALDFDACFDAVFSNAALHWVANQAGAARGMTRALRPGGRLIAEFGGRGNMRSLEAAVADTLQRVAGMGYRSRWIFPGLGEYVSLLEKHGMEVRSAWLFDRPTRLDGADGVRQWLTMFMPDLLEPLAKGVRERVLSAVEEALRPTWWRDGAWHADYRRLRIVAVRAT